VGQVVRSTLESSLSTFSLHLFSLKHAPPDWDIASLELVNLVHLVSHYVLRAVVCR